MLADEITVLSLCSGGGGLDLGLALACPQARTVAYVEREAFAVAELLRRMEENELDAAPVWSDVKTFDGAPWRGLVDFVIGGYPCQPFSFAGSRAGRDDPRHLWPDILRIVGECQPWGVWFENVSGHLSLGFEEVVCDLERLGYRLACGLFSAAEVGASHKRERLLILGMANAGPQDVHGRGSELQSGAARGADWHSWPTPRGEDSECCGNHPDSLNATASLWATPQTENAAQGPDKPGQREGHQNLVGQVSLWPTPHGIMGTDQTGKMVEAWPTPGANDSKGSNKPGQQAELLANWTTPSATDSDRAGSLTDAMTGTSLGQQIGSLYSRPDQATESNGSGSSPSSPISHRPRLSPIFVAYLMGWPATVLGFSDFAAMASCPSAPPTPSAPSGWRSRMISALKELTNQGDS